MFIAKRGMTHLLATPAQRPDLKSAMQIGMALIAPLTAEIQPRVIAPKTGQSCVTRIGTGSIVANIVYQIRVPSPGTTVTQMEALCVSLGGMEQTAAISQAA